MDIFPLYIRLLWEWKTYDRFNFRSLGKCGYMTAIHWIQKSVINVRNQFNFSLLKPTEISTTRELP